MIEALPRYPNEVTLAGLELELLQVHILFLIEDSKDVDVRGFHQWIGEDSNLKIFLRIQNLPGHTEINLPEIYLRLSCYVEIVT